MFVTQHCGVECANCDRPLRDPGVGLVRRLLGEYPDEVGFACEGCGRQICSSCRNQMTMNVGIGFEGKCPSCGGRMSRR